VTAPDPGPPVADPEAKAAELVARWCGTRKPGVLELLDELGIDLTAGVPGQRPEPAPRVLPDMYRRGRKGKSR